jgi:hypothetical protein
MAEAFKKLFDSTLNASNLNDGEHTLLSGGNNKVIKSVSVSSPDMTLRNTYLELDGVNIGSVNASEGGTVTLEGDQILSPSSVLKLKTNDFPRVAEKVIGICYDNGRLRYYGYVEGPDGSAVDISGTSAESAVQFNWETIETSLSYSNDAIDVMFSSANGNHLYYVSHDNNSVQTYYSTRARTVGGPNTGFYNNNFQYTYQNYKSFGLKDHNRTWDTTTTQNQANNGWYSMNSSGTLERHHPSNYINSFTLQTGHIGTYWGTNTAHPNPYPTSSYPRGGMFHNFYCYITSLNSDPYKIYLKNTVNGAFYRFPMPTPLDAANGDFVMAVDHINDEWYIYGYLNSSQIQQLKGPWSWTEMKNGTGSAAVTTNVRKDITSWADQNVFNVGTMSNDMQGGQFGYTSRGGVRYKTNNNEMVTLDTGGNELFRYNSDPLHGNKGNDATRLWRHFGHPVLNTNAAAAGLSDADVKVTITGIEQT